MHVEDIQRVVDRINQLIAFEFVQHDVPEDVRIHATGFGPMPLSDLNNNVVGAEVVSDGDTVEGVLDMVCVYSTPTQQCLRDADMTEIPTYDQSLMLIVQMQDCV